MGGLDCAGLGVLGGFFGVKTAVLRSETAGFGAKTSTLKEFISIFLLEAKELLASLLIPAWRRRSTLCRAVMPSSTSLREGWALPAGGTGPVERVALARRSSDDMRAYLFRFRGTGGNGPLWSLDVGACGAGS